MSWRNYLLFIDDRPIEKEYDLYFAQFNIGIKVQNKLPSVNGSDRLPLALLIHWRILENETHFLFPLYQSYPVPIIVINDKPNDAACVLVLESGADDYISGPITPKALHARITAIARRITREGVENKPEPNAFQFANWRMYPASRQIFDEQNRELQLSAGEYDLLYLFVQQPQRVLHREELLQVTKQSDHSPFDRRIDVQISRLRQKIERDAKKPTLIKTIRNGGYVFTAQVTSDRVTHGA